MTTDIATKGGQYDVVTIGAYAAPIWAQQDWRAPLDGLAADKVGFALAPDKGLGKRGIWLWA